MAEGQKDCLNSNLCVIKGELILSPGIVSNLILFWNIKIALYKCWTFSQMTLNHGQLSWSHCDLPASPWTTHTPESFEFLNCKCALSHLLGDVEALFSTSGSVLKAWKCSSSCWTGQSSTASSAEDTHVYGTGQSYVRMCWIHCLLGEGITQKYIKKLSVFRCLFNHSTVQQLGPRTRLLNLKVNILGSCLTKFVWSVFSVGM